MDDSGTWRLGRRPALDGLRGIAVLLVLVNHTGASGVLTIGQAGVTAFFVLSGFLITALLLEERQASGAVDMARFYTRRLRRLAPALVACSIAAATVAIPMGRLYRWQVIAGLTYTSDFTAASGAGLHGALMHTWSLSIEEQFYLAWSLLLVFVRSRPRLLWTAGAGVAAVAGWRVLLSTWGASAPRLTYSPDTRADALLLGCLLAALLVGRTAVAPPLWLGRGCLASLVLVAPLPFTVWMPLMEAVLTIGAIWAIVTTRPTRALTLKPITWLGSRSYGLYLWHYPILSVSDALLPVTWIGRAIVWLPLSLVVSELSWRFIEQPFLRHREPTRTTVIMQAPATAPAPATGP